MNSKNNLWEFDLVGPLPKSKRGYSYLLTMIDHCTKRAEVRPLGSKEAGEVIPSIEDIIDLLGTPKTILTDNGKEFANSLAKELADRKEIIWRYGAPYSPTTTELIERFNRTFMDKLRKVTGYGQKDWPAEIETATRAYMNGLHRAIGCTPNEAWEYPRKICRKYKAKYRDSYEWEGKKVAEKEVELGDRVLYHNPLGRGNKLAADYNISGTVTKKNFGSVEVRLADGRTISSALKNVKRLF